MYVFTYVCMYVCTFIVLHLLCNAYNKLFKKNCYCYFGSGLKLFYPVEVYEIYIFCLIVTKTYCHLILLNIVYCLVPNNSLL